MGMTRCPRSLLAGREYTGKVSIAESKCSSRGSSSAAVRAEVERGRDEQGNSDETVGDEHEVGGHDPVLIDAHSNSNFLMALRRRRSAVKNEVQQMASLGARSGRQRATLDAQNTRNINDLAVSGPLATDQKVRSSNLFGRAIYPGSGFKLASVLGLLCCDPLKVARADDVRLRHSILPALGSQSATALADHSPHSKGCGKA